MWSRPRNGRDARAVRQRHERTSGYTLLEVVVAVTLTAVLMAILLTGLRLGANAWHRGDEALTAHARRLAELESLSLQIASAVPRVLVLQSDGRPVRYVSFWGTRSEMRFLTRFSWARDRSRGLWLASHRVVETQANRQQLLISEVGVLDGEQLRRLFLREVPPVAGGEPLGEPAERIEFSYLQPSSARGAAGWVSEWRAEEQDELPRAVRVQWRRNGNWQGFTFPIPAARGNK